MSVYIIIACLFFDSLGSAKCRTTEANSALRYAALVAVAIKSPAIDRMADSINVKFDMDATWTKSKLLHKTLKRAIVSVKLHLTVQKKPSVRFKHIEYFYF